MNLKDIYIVIPAKDESKRIGLVIRKVRREGFTNIIVVNDGSSDDTSKIARDLGVIVLDHLVNLGPGAATQTGMDFALAQGARIIVTLDGDNQHCPTDIKHLIAKMEEESLDVVIGSRFLLASNNIPKIRLLFNKVGNWVTAIFTGLKVSDSQSGFKAMNISFVENAQINLNGYEFCTEIIGMIKRNDASYSEVPIKVRYTKESMAKGQTFGNGVRMVGNFIRYFF